MTMPFQKGQVVQYFSSSHNQWVECNVDDVQPTGEVMLSCKPGYWMPVAEQQQKVRPVATPQAAATPAAAPVRPAAPGAVPGAAAGYAGGVAPAAPVAGGPGRPAVGQGCGGYAPLQDGRQPDSSPGGALNAERRRLHTDDYREELKTRAEEISPEQKLLIRKALESAAATTHYASQLFQRCDANKDNRLDHDELNDCLLAMTQHFGIPQFAPSKIPMLVSKFDQDQDGALSPAEFEEFFKRLLVKTRESFMQWKVHCEFFVEKQPGDPWQVYEQLKALGSGTFGVTHLVRDTRVAGDLSTRVMKTVNKAKSNMPPEELEQEIKNLKMVDHPHIIKIFEYYEDAINIYLVMEAANGGELLEVISEQHKRGWKLSERWAATVMQQVLEAIAYCHGRKLMHKDLKAENIMLLHKTDAQVHPHAVVIDLGLAEMFGSGLGGGRQAESIVMRQNRTQDEIDHNLYARVRSKKIGGTPTTMAPEVWRAYMDPVHMSFGMKCDVYSLGIVLYQLLTGVLPFMARSLNPQEWLCQIERGAPRPPLARCTPEAQDLTLRMLFEEAQRPTAREALRHDWFRIKSQNHGGVELNAEQMQALCDFHERNEFQKAVVLQAASQLRACDVPEINALFRRYDENNAGFITIQALLEVLKSMGVDDDHAQRAAYAIDLDQNGKIEYTEFVAACISQFDTRLEACLFQIFSRLDKDNSGELARKEVMQLLQDGELRGLGFTPSGTEIQNMLNEMDPRRTGRISFEDFARYCNPSAGHK